MSGPQTVVAVLGLGEAGAAIGHDLVASGVTVRGFDPLTGGPAGLAPGTLYADLNTSSAGLKLRLAAMAEQRGVAFADVAMMSPVPGRGIRTPMLVSGP